MLADLPKNIATDEHFVYNNKVYTRRLFYKKYYTREWMNNESGTDNPVNAWLNSEEGKWCSDHAVNIFSSSYNDFVFDGIHIAVLGYMTDQNWTAYILKFR